MKLFIERMLSAIVLGCFLSSVSMAQEWKRKRVETVLGFGTSQFFSDIGGFSRGENAGGIRDLSISQARFNVNINFKYRVTENLNARISLTYGFLHASDVRGSNIGRGFEASVSIFEPALIGEYYFIRNKSENSFLFSKTDDGKKAMARLIQSLEVYAFTGFGGVRYSIDGNDKLLSTGMKTGGFTGIIPVGLGTTLIFSPDFNFGVELGWRYTFSDMLDGYSSPYSKSNDFYSFLNFTITYKLNTGINGLPTFR